MTAPERRHPRFLVVRRDNIGDLVCTTPLIAAMRAQYPRSWIGVLANTYNAPILECNPDVDAVFAYHKLKHGGANVLSLALQRIGMVRALRREALDFAVIATPGLVPRVVRFVGLLKAKQVIAFVPRGKLAAGVDVAVAPDDDEGVNEVEMVWRLAPALGLAGDPPPLKVVPAADELARVKTALADLPGTGPIVGLHISARKPSQRWPIERFAALVRALHAAHGARFLLLWSPGAETDRKHPGDDAKAADLVGLLGGMPVLPWPTTALRELIGAIAACDRMVLSDGGAMHIAAALGKPLVAFFGQSDLGRWRPWRARAEIVQSATREASDITLAEAIDAYHRLPAGPI